MTGVRTFKIGLDAERISSIVAAKGERSLSVCIPCRDEVATIGPIVQVIRDQLIDRLGIVDELIVLDDRSTDGTAQVAALCGARVVSIEDIHESQGTGHGKGNALWASLLVSSGDIVVWLDGDVTSFDHDWVLRLAAPLLEDDSVALVKAYYHRPTDQGGGGRTTELVARPLLSLLCPDLARVIQPLAGEYAVRRSVVEAIPFVEGWGVEIAMLLDVAQHHGAESIGQVDLGIREHRNRSLSELAVQAAEIMATLHSRVLGARALSDEEATLIRPDGSVVPLNLAERRPLSQLDTGDSSVSVG